MINFKKIFFADGRARITIPLLILTIILVSFIFGFYFLGDVVGEKALGPHANNRLIVKFKEDSYAQAKKNTRISGADIGVASVTEKNKKHNVKDIQKLVPQEEQKQDELQRVYRIDFEKEQDIPKLIKEYQKDPNIEYAEPDYLVAAQLEPNDPYYYSSGSWGQSYDDLWGIKKINSSAAWNITVGSNAIIVAVIDTGVDYNHPDLAANIWTNNDEIPNNGIDDDSNGYIDDYYGYDFYNYDGNPIDDHAHGTHVAGTIGGVGNNNLGVVGVNWNVGIMAVKFLNNSGSGYISDAVSSTYYAVNNGAKVLSNSWGGGGRSTTMQTAINYAYNNNVVYVAAAGNSNSDAYNYTPAGLEHVMTISATDYLDNKASFSSWGDVVEFAAPGVDVLSLKAQGGSCTTVAGYYCRMSGTSMATPHAAGLAALILSVNPGLNPNQVQQTMQAGADDLGSSGKDIYFGYGRINAGNSLVPLSHVDGTLIKTASAPEVYLLDGGKKRHIPNPEVFASWFDWRDIIIITSSEMNSYESASELSFRPGVLVKASGDPKVYLIEDSSKRHIVSPEVFLGLGYKWSNIHLTTAAEEDKYNTSDDIASTDWHINGSLIKTASAPEVYLLDGGKRRHIPNPEVFKSRYRWSEILLISDEEMKKYSNDSRVNFRPGSLVRAADQYEVYVITGTTKRHISSPTVFVQLGYRWDRIITTNIQELNNYQTGPDI